MKNTKLFHYTNAGGLQGILNSQSLWATHYRHLNDYSEYAHGQNLINSILPDIFLKNKELIKNKFPKFSIEKGHIEKLATFYDGQIKIHEQVTLGIYITSYCEHSRPTEYDNGILSMWHGYGQDGGYAIELDMSEFNVNMQQADTEYLFNGLFEKVTYLNNKPDLVRDHFFTEFEKNMETFLNYIGNETITEEQSFARNKVLYAPLLLKSKYYEGENEWRHIIAPNDKSTPEASKESRKQVSLHSYEKNGRLVPYIDILSYRKKENQQFSLPIKRIIVGPHPDQKRRVDSLKILGKKQGFEVHPSEITFIGM